MSGDQQVLTVPPEKASESLLESEVEKAKAWLRFFASLVDVCLIALIYLIIFLVFGSGLSLEGTFALSYFTNIFLSLVYFTVCYSTKGQTLGKKIFGIKVISVDEEALNFATGIIRYIGYYISALLLLVGFIIIPFTKEKQGLHDKLAGTIVVKVRKSASNESQQNKECLGD